MFSLPGLLLPGCSLEQVEPELSVVRHRDAELWIAIKGKLRVRHDDRWASYRRRSTQLEWAVTSRGYQPYPGS